MKMLLRSISQNARWWAVDFVLESDEIGGHRGWTYDCPSHLLSQTPTTSGFTSRVPWRGRELLATLGCGDLPVEIHPLLSELPVAVVRVLKGLVLDDLHPFSPVTLLVAVLADHVQLSDFVLQSTEEETEWSALSLSDKAPPN